MSMRMGSVKFLGWLGWQVQREGESNAFTPQLRKVDKVHTEASYGEQQQRAFIDLALTLTAYDFTPSFARARAYF